MKAYVRYRFTYKGKTYEEGEIIVGQGAETLVHLGCCSIIEELPPYETKPHNMNRTEFKGGHP